MVKESQRKVRELYFSANNQGKVRECKTKDDCHANLQLFLSCCRLLRMLVAALRSLMVFTDIYSMISHNGDGINPHGCSYASGDILTGGLSVLIYLADWETLLVHLADWETLLVHLADWGTPRPGTPG